MTSKTKTSTENVENTPLDSSSSPSPSNYVKPSFEVVNLAAFGDTVGTGGTGGSGSGSSSLTSETNTAPT